MKKFFEGLNKISLYLLIFLFPLFFLPFTQNILSFPKQLLLLLLGSLSLIGWTMKQIINGNFLIRKNNFLYFSSFILFLSFLISSIFSLWGMRFSIIGIPLNITDSLLSLSLFIILAFLVANSFNKEEVLKSFLLLVISTGIAGLINLFQLYNIFLFPFDFSKNLSFNLIGSQNSFAIIAAILLPLSIVLSLKGKKFLRVILLTISFIFFANIILINFKTAWLGLIISILTIFAVNFDNKKIKSETGSVLVLMLGLIISLFFYAFPISIIRKPNLPPEVLPTSVSEVRLIQKEFSKARKNIALGTGPGTFTFDYSHFHSPSVNKTIFWGTRFSKGNSVFLDWVATKGSIGVISLFLFYISILYLITKHIENKEENDIEDKIKLSIAGGILGLIVISFIYPFNFTLYLVFWLLIGYSLFYFNLKTTKITLSSTYRTTVANLFLATVVISSIGLLFAFGKAYLADTRYTEGIKTFQKKNIDKSISLLKKATRLNPFIDSYWRDLSQFELAKIKAISKNNKTTKQLKSKQINAAIINGANDINRAVRIAPMNVANWNVRGFFYRNLIGINNASAPAVKSYQVAIQLEPSSPFSYTELARVQILIAQNDNKNKKKKEEIDALSTAIRKLKMAINLKPDYIPAHYLLAIAYDQLGEKEKAINELKIVKNNNPKDSGILFQLGVLYWRDKKIDAAEQMFKKSVEINPNYSNARYMLGLIYNKLGKKEKAEKEFSKVAELNPKNTQIKDILKKLKNGLPISEETNISHPKQLKPNNILSK